MRVVCSLLCVIAGLVGCDDAPANGTTGPADGGGSGLSVQIGTPDTRTGIDFVPLLPGGDISLETFGQGGTHAAVGIRCTGFGSRAFVDVTLENLSTGTQVKTPPSLRPQLLTCSPADPGVCDAVPINVMTGGLADPALKDGLAVRVSASVHNDAGAMAMGSEHGVLRKAF